MTTNTAYKIVNIEQNSSEWHEWRAGGIGASSMPAIMGESPYETPLQYWREKVGLDKPKDLSNNPHVRRGVENEEPARQAFDSLFGEFSMPMCVEGSKSHYRVSLDGLTSQGAVLEIKCPVEEKVQNAIQWVMDQMEADESNHGAIGREELESLGLYYWAQVQYQLAIVNAPYAILWVWSVESSMGAKLYIYPDAEYQARLLEAADKMWNSVQTLNPPAADADRDSLTDLSDEFNQAEAEYLEAARAAKALEAELKLLKETMAVSQAKMVSEMGSFASATGSLGLKVTKFVRKGTVDWEKLLGEIAPDLDPNYIEGYRKAASESVKITLPKI